MKRLYSILIFTGLIFFNIYAQKPLSAHEQKVVIKTTQGDIVIKLYNETPLHRDNFIKLVKSKFYNRTLFHRVIADFMIQAGDPDSKKAQPADTLGNGDLGYTVPAEFENPLIYNKYGAIAAARESDNINPQKASSASQFYIVVGKKFTDSALNALENKRKQLVKEKIYRQLINDKQKEIVHFAQKNDTIHLKALNDSVVNVVSKELTNNPTLWKFSDEQRQTYKTLGGTPHLDGNYTVFGEVIKGMNIVEKISKEKTNSLDRPLKDIRILSMKLVK